MSNIRITTVDPGMIKPVQVGTAISGPNNLDMENTFSEWSVMSDSFLKDSGRTRSVDFECKRRSSNTNYSLALAKLAETKRCADCSIFDKYVAIRIEHLPVLKEELFTSQRRNNDWKAGSRLLSYLSRLCDRMFDRGSLKYRTWMNRERDPETLKSLKKILRTKKKQRRSGPDTVVFFGDGTFKPGGFGHAPIPKKNILKLLCTRGQTVLLDEFRTSKTCPCGNAELDTSSNNFSSCTVCEECNDQTGLEPKTKPSERTHCRIRCHKTFLTDGSATTLPCNVFKMLDKKNIPPDRDVMAVINMLRCGHNAIRGLSRPVHLCRNRSRS